MSAKTYATLTSKGQITIPAELRKQWNLKAGDKIAFEKLTDDKGTIRPERRRSIFEVMKEWEPVAISKPLTLKDIDDAIGAEVSERHLRVMAQWKK